MDEGLIEVQFDEVLDPRPGKEGKTWHFISVKKPGQGTAELFVTETMYQKVKDLKLSAGDPLGLIFRLSKFRGQFEARLGDVVALALA
jgi:hypothetical protein